MQPRRAGRAVAGRAPLPCQPASVFPASSQAARKEKEKKSDKREKGGDLSRAVSGNPLHARESTSHFGAELCGTPRA